MTLSFFSKLLLQGSIALLPACLMAQTGLPFALPPHPPAAAVIAAEYFFDADPGWGNALPLPLGTNPGNTVTTSFPVSLNNLNTGVHQLYTRVKDAHGKWSLNSRKSLFIINPGFTVPQHSQAAAIVQAECFIGNDPGFGNGTALTLVPGTDITITNTAIDISALANGTHNIYFRCKDADGRWSLTNRKGLSVIVTNILIPAHPIADHVKSIEYFLDTDPGWGNGTPVTVPLNGNLSNIAIAVNTSMLTDGYHQLHIRTLGNRSLTNVKMFSIGSPLPVNLTSFEALLSGIDVPLSWEVALPHQVGQFEVERSRDGIRFDNVDAAIQQESDHRFTAIDKAVTRLQSTKLYYRLKIKEAGNQYTYSPVVSIMLNPDPGTFVISAAPNPFSSVLSFQCDLPEEEMMEFRWMDLSGRVVHSDKIATEKGFTKINLKTETLPGGIYILGIKYGNHHKTMKLVKTLFP